MREKPALAKKRIFKEGRRATLTNGVGLEGGCPHHSNRENQCTVLFSCKRFPDNIGPNLTFICSSEEDSGFRRIMVSVPSIPHRE
jgi:hypothetical protein